MVSKVTVFIAAGLVIAFLLAGGGALTKDVLDKTKIQFGKVESGIAERTKKTQERSQ